MTSLQIRLMATLKVQGNADGVPGSDLEFLEGSLLDDITTREALTEALDDLVAREYLVEKAGVWTLTPKGTAYIVAELAG